MNGSPLRRLGATVACLLATACADDAGAGGRATGGAGAEPGDGGATTSGGGGAGGGGSSAGGAAALGDWSCIGALDAPMFEDGADVTVFDSAIDFAGVEGIADVVVRVCAYADADCATPYAEATSDVMGDVTLTMPTDARYYLDYSAPAIAPTLAFLNGPPNSDPWAHGTFLLTQAELMGFIALAGVRADPQRGHIGVTVRDCDDVLGAGVQVSVDTADGASVVGYLAADGLLDLELTQTTTDGRLGILNVPVGEATVSAVVVATNELISRRTIVVRAGAISYAADSNPFPEAP